MTSFSDFILQTQTSAPLDAIVLDKPVSIESIPTPALTIDLDLLDSNLGKMQTHVSSNRMALRAHTKMHKSPIIAKMQLDQGACGICCATVSEAEIMARAGIANILITSPVVTEDKMIRVIALARHSDELAIVVDHIKNATAFNTLALAENINLSVYIDLDPGMGRTGVSLGDDALSLGKHIIDHCPNLKFEGLQMYVGNCMHISGFEKRKSKYEYIMQKGRATKDLFESEGIAVPIFTGGGTGTYDMEPSIGLINELQAGSYAFMDIEYRDIGGESSELFEDFETSLLVLTTAISQPQSSMITVDAGIKCLATDTAYPEFKDVEGLIYHFGGDEHGIVQLNNPSKIVNLGDRLNLITSHCDPTVNLYDYYYPHRNGIVEEIWPISARGKSQ